MQTLEYAARQMSDATGIEWRPIVSDTIDKNYIISVDGQIYNYKIQKHLNGCKQSQYKYIKLRHEGKQRFCQISELMLNSFPELFTESAQIQWKRIEYHGEPTLYEVSDNGDVRRINNRRPVKPQISTEGYLIIRFRHNGKTVTEFAHRLVARAFIENPFGFDIVNHKDENRQNNSVKNLEWCDRRYNILYCGAAERAGAHSLLTKKLKALSEAGNRVASDILKIKKYYEKPDLLEKALALTV